MKRVTLLMLAFVGSMTLQAQGPQILTQSTDQTTIDGGIACGNSTATLENSYYRSYVLADYGISGSFDIGGVQFGVGSASASIDLTIKIHLNSGSAFPNGTLTELGSITKTVTTADEGTLVYADLSSPINIPATSVIVLEILAPDLSAIPAQFYIGGNDLGETGLDYISSPGCGGISPTSIETIPDANNPGTFFEHDMIINLVEEGALATENQILTQISLYPNPVEDVLNITLPASVELQSATMHDLLGKQTQVNVNGNNSIDMSQMAAGVYILKLETSQGTLTKKVIKQ